MARVGLTAGSHAGKALLNILATYPRDELFQTGEDDLLRTAMGILHLYDRQRFRLFVRRDAFERFVSCLIYAPRENYSTDLRQKWQAILIQAFNGTSSEFNVSLSESVLARIQITVRTTPGAIPDYDVKATRGAPRRGRAPMVRRPQGCAGGHDGRGRRDRALPRSTARRFPRPTASEFPASAAVPDIEMMSRLSEAAPIAMSLYRPSRRRPGMLRFQLVHRGKPVALSESLPMLEHMGLRVLDEHLHRIAPQGMPPVAMHDFGLQSALPGADMEVDTLHEVFEDAFARIFRGEVESDDFNRLVVASRIPAAEIVILRAYAKYMRQIGFALSQSFIEATLAAHADIARMLVQLFKARFDPDGGAGAGSRPPSSEREIEAALDEVDNLSEDRVLRQYLALMRATTRTNFWRRDDKGKRAQLPVLQVRSGQGSRACRSRKPMFEIFVYSTRFEGVHLRGGRVARGGLRWSDRPEDFRTEVLGLVKAQMVKNTVIVPVGSKGGFVLKRAPAASDREAFMKEGVACYQDYLRGLLDITDNLVEGKVVPPPQREAPRCRRSVSRGGCGQGHGDILRLRQCASARSTASGSPTRSPPAAPRATTTRRWASPRAARGSRSSATSARWAWTRRRPISRWPASATCRATCSATGCCSRSTSGSSRPSITGTSSSIRTPDAAASFAERERLFELPRSSWADYDVKLISAGGGVHPRTAKSIAITPEVKAALGITADALTPTELVNAILKAPVDLDLQRRHRHLRQSHGETHAQVGDRANDAVRVNGRELRCKVFAEGGNLGCTQLGRIEFAQAGGRINTDAIDNSAGVDTSDHEVNIKILLGLPIAEGDLTRKQRNTLLARDDR